MQDAINKETPIPVIISQSVVELFKSRMSESDAYKSIALIRHGFEGTFRKEGGGDSKRKENEPNQQNITSQNDFMMHLP